MKPVKRGWPLFFLAACAFYLYGLGALPFVGPDEPRYAQVAREMLSRADMVTPTLGGHTWFEKPALLYWMVMASFTAFGVSEWAARLGPACAGLLTILAVGWMGRRVERACEQEGTAAVDEDAARAGESTLHRDDGALHADDGALRRDESDLRRDESGAVAERAGLAGRARGLGFWSALALGSSSGLMIFSRAVSFDVIVTMTMTAALASFFVSELELVERRRNWLLAAFYALTGASLLAKGLIGIVLPGGIICAYFLLQRKWPEKRLLMSLLWGAPLALIVAALWYGPVIERHGWKFIDEFIIQHHFARYVSNKYHHPGPFYYYLPALLILALPWPFFLLSALARIKKWKWSGVDALSRLRLFALVWMLVPVAFFSVSGSKLPGYILPALPGAALLIGEQLARIVRGAAGTLAIRLTGLLLIGLGAAGLIYLRRTAYVPGGGAYLVLGPIFVAGAVSLGAAHLRRLCLILTAAALFLSLALGVGCAAKVIAQRESTRELLREAAARGFESAPVCGLYVIERTAEFYAGTHMMREPDGEVTSFEGGAQVLDAARRTGGGSLLVFVPLDAVNQLTEYSALTTEIIGDNGTVALLAVREKRNDER